MNLIMSKKKKRRVLRKESIFLTIVFCIALAIVVISGIKLVGIKISYSQADKKYKAAREAYLTTENTYSSDDNNEQTSNLWYEDISVDFDKLKGINSEIVGWIYFEDEDISYPVLFSGDNAKYLSTSYDGEYLKAGSIFMDGSNNPDFLDNHTIIYGHNMKNMSMFGKLRYYRQNNDYCESHKYFQIHTEDMKYRYMVVSYREVETDDDIYTVYKTSNEEFYDFVKETIGLSSKESEDLTIDDETKIITLSTCSKGDKRFVVSAVLIDEH